MRRSMQAFVLILVLLIFSLSWNAQAASYGQTDQPFNEPEPERSLYGNDFKILPSQNSYDHPPVTSGIEAVENVPSEKVWQTYDNDWEIEFSGESAFLQLTNNEYVDIQPRFNRGNAEIAFVSNRDGNYEIYRMASDGSGVSRLTWNDASDVRPFWSPDGTRIVFQSDRDGQSEIYVMDNDSSNVIRLTYSDDYDGMPAWSPDGSKIAFISRRTGGYRIWVMNPDGSDLVQLPTQPYSADVVWSPDGRQILYDADGDQDGWQELWLINADGSDAKQLLDSNQFQTDLWAGSWAPDMKSLAFTRVSFELFNGEWYWVRGDLEGLDLTLNTVFSIYGSGRSWNPDWRSLDNVPPVSSMQALSPQSPAYFQVSWSGQDENQYNPVKFDVQYKEGVNGAWQDWLIATSSTSDTFQGEGGVTYFFRARATDPSWNFEPWPVDFDAYTMVEAMPPRTAINAMDAYTRGESFPVRWLSMDPGNSGLLALDAQYRIGTGGIWQDWMTAVLEGGGFFTGIPGQTYSFRVRAQDKALNLEGWAPEERVATTTVYRWGVRGTIVDNTGSPINSASINLNPIAITPSVSDHKGLYGAFSGLDAQAYSAEWEKDGYGDLPITQYEGLSDAKVDVVLPPSNNLVQNSTFETGVLYPWVGTGSGISTTVVSTQTHTGHYAVRLGASQTTLIEKQTVSTTEVYDFGYADWTIDQEATVHIIFGDIGNPSNLYYRRIEKTGQMVAPVKITSDYGSPNLELSPDDTPHIVYLSGGNKIVHATIQNGKWVKETVHSFGGTIHIYPEITFDENGGIYLAWVNNNIIYYTDNLLGTWSAPIPITDNQYSSMRAISLFRVDPTGAVTIIDQSLYVLHKSAYGNWIDIGTPSGTDGCTMDDFVVDPSGNIHITCMKIISNNGEIFYFEYLKDGTWSQGINVSNTQNPSAFSGIEITMQGDLYIAWLEFANEPPYKVMYAYKHAGESWSAPIELFNDVAGLGSGIDVFTVDGDTIHILANDCSQTLHDFRITPGGAGTIDRIYDPVEYCDVRFGIDRNQDIYTLWVQNGYGGYLQYQTTKGASENGDASLSQLITLPVTMTNPVLSFNYLYEGQLGANGTGLDVVVDNGNASTNLFSTRTATGGWAHQWIDLTPWLSQTVTITFQISQQEGGPYARVYLDDVTVGSAYANVQVDLTGPQMAQPGREMTEEIIYRNQAGVTAEQTVITLTLPAGVTFNGADIDPTTQIGNVLVWNVDDLSGQNDPGAIKISFRVDESTPSGSHLVSEAQISTASSELELLNNHAQSTLWITEAVYLPTIIQ